MSKEKVVYIVTGGEYDDYRIYGAFSSKEYAQNLKSKKIEEDVKLWGNNNANLTSFYIEEWILDDDS